MKIISIFYKATYKYIVNLIEKSTDKYYCCSICSYLEIEFFNNRKLLKIMLVSLYL